MNRRRFLQAGLASGVAATTGCLGLLGGGSPPPRRSRVFENVAVTDDGTLQVALVDQPRVESRQDVSADLDPVDAVGAVSPVGVAAAQKGGGRGATGRGVGGYSTAPKGRHGWAVWHGDDDDDEWRDNHQDEIAMYPAAIDQVGVAHLGPESQYEDDPPGPGPLAWDEQWADPEAGQTLAASLAEASPGSDAEDGWYRLGVHLVHQRGNADFGWQGADLKLDDDAGWTVEKAWHVRPRV